MEHSTRARRTLSTILAVFLAVEAVAAVAAAAATTTVSHPLPAETPAGHVLAVEATVAPALPAVAPHFSAPAFAPRVVEQVDAPVKVVAKVTEPPKATKATKSTKVTKAPAKVTKAPAKVTKPAAKVTKPAAKVTKPAAKVTKPAAKAPAKTTTKTGAASYSGTNHVWIPELGINRSVRAFPCDRERAPDNYMYRWGCAGTNNVYLMGHAHSVMNGLHDAYVSGRLHKGMTAYYADSNGNVRTYSVRWWKKTLPTTGAAWAWASQDVPSMTLQTCVGSNSEYRLMVRLVAIDG